MICMIVVSVIAPITGLVITVTNIFVALNKNQAGQLPGNEYAGVVSGSLRFTAFGLLVSVVPLLILWGLYEHSKTKRRRRR